MAMYENEKKLHESGLRKSCGIMFPVREEGKNMRRRKRSKGKKAAKFSLYRLKAIFLRFEMVSERLGPKFRAVKNSTHSSKISVTRS